MPGNPPANWRDISPTGLIPAIDDGGFRLADSTAIVHYLERKQPAPGLLPTDDRELGEALFLDAWAGTALFRNVVHPIFHNQVVNPNIRKVPADQAAIHAAMNEAAPEAFGYLESRATDRFVVGGKLSIADLTIVSNLVVFHYLGKRIVERFPRLQAYFRRHLDSPMLGAPPWPTRNPTSLKWASTAASSVSTALCGTWNSSRAQQCARSHRSVYGHGGMETSFCPNSGKTVQIGTSAD